MKANILQGLESTAAQRMNEARYDNLRQRDFIETAEDLRMLREEVSEIPPEDPRFAELADLANPVIARIPWRRDDFYDLIGFGMNPQSAKMLLQMMAAHYRRVARKMERDDR